jgi:hypothetical protein
LIAGVVTTDFLNIRLALKFILDQGAKKATDLGSRSNTKNVEVYL